MLKQLLPRHIQAGVVGTPVKVISFSIGYINAVYNVCFVYTFAVFLNRFINCIVVYIAGISGSYFSLICNSEKLSSIIFNHFFIIIFTEIKSFFSGFIISKNNIGIVDRFNLIQYTFMKNNLLLWV